MPNIDDKLTAILEAKYGEAVRGSIHDAIEEINEVVENWESGLMDTTLTSTELPAQGKAVGDAVKKNTQKIAGLYDSIVYDSKEIGREFRPAFEPGDVVLNSSGFQYFERYFNTRARVPEKYTLRLHVGDVVKLSNYDGYSFYMGWYNEDGGYYSRTTSWVTEGEFTCIANGPHKILIQSTNPYTDINELTSLVTITPVDQYDTHEEIQRIDNNTKYTTQKIAGLYDSIVYDSKEIGREFRPAFEPGDAVFNSSGFRYFERYLGTRARVPEKYTLRLHVGDVVKLSNYDGYSFYMGWYNEDGGYYSRTTSWVTEGEFTCIANGPHKILIQSTNPYTDINELTSLVTITPVDQYDTHSMKLPADPYRNIPWSIIKDVTSASHAHCTTQSEFDTLKARYDHVAISNYYPSSPCYPLADFFTDIGTTLASPNAEQHGMRGINSHVHLNCIGSYIMSDQTYKGTLPEMLDEGIRTMRFANSGGITLNHPKWSELNKTTIEEYIALGGIIAIEIWNSSSEASNQTGYSLDLWDQVLSDGIQIFGTAVPDHEARYHPAEERQPFGYNHMLVNAKTEEEILSAYRMGHFYTTLYNDGLLLKNYVLDANGVLTIEVSEASTFVFTTATRTVTVDSAAVTATFTTQPGDIYVRAEADRGNNKLFTNAIML